MEGKKILVIDDDVNLCQMIKITFTRAGATVTTAFNGLDGLQAFFQEKPDLVILDVMMPEMNGWEVCRQIRLLADTPIIMLTSLDGDQDIVRGLNYGADDFVTKPCSGKVLLARANATLRRVAAAGEKPAKTKGFSDDYLDIDLEKRRVQVDGEPIKLTATEYRLLSFLVENTGQIHTYERILDRVWGWEYRGSIDYVHVYVSYLRRKIEKDPKNPEYLLTERGVGYLFN